MINYKDPVVELNPQPVALDAAVQRIQERFAAELPWLQKAFGRATAQQERFEGAKGVNPSRNNRVYPEAYYRREPFSLMPNDNLRSYCFFVVRDPLKFTEWKPLDMDARAEQPVGIVFWGNLQKVDATREYNFAEELRRDVVRALKRCPDFVLEESSVQYDRVFAPFTITEAFRQYQKPPYFAFRLDGILHYDYLNC